MDEVITHTLRINYSEPGRKYSPRLIRDVEDVLDGDEAAWGKEDEIASLIWCSLGGSSKIAKRAAATIVLADSLDT